MNHSSHQSAFFSKFHSLSYLNLSVSLGHLQKCVD